MLFEDFPTEIVRAIGSQLTRCTDIKALGQTSRRHHAVLDDILFRNNAEFESSSALVWALERGDLKTARKAIKYGANPKDRWRGQDPLEIAVRGGYGEIIELLLKGGALPYDEIEDEDFTTFPQLRRYYSSMSGTLAEFSVQLRQTELLCVAAADGREDIAAMLVNHGVKVSNKGLSGGTPLMLAALGGHGAVVDFLLRAGADVHEISLEGRTALISAIQSGSKHCVELLVLDGKANVNQHLMESNSPLQLAVENGNPEIVEMLVRRGAMIRYAATLAASQERPQILQFFLDTGLSVEHMNDVGLTLLQSAVEGRCVENVKVLLRNGASIQVKNSDSLTPVMLACRVCSEEIVWLLLLHGATFEPDRVDTDMKEKAAVAGAHGLVNLYLNNGVDMDAQWRLGFNALMAASACGDDEMVRQLLWHGAQLDLTSDTGRTALLIAAEEGYCNIANLLLNLGADVHTRDDEGESVLLKAAVHGDIELIEKAMMMSGFEIDDVNNFGHTMLSIAAEFGRDKLVMWLIGKGANPNHKDDEGDTPYDIAVAYEHKTTAKILSMYMEEEEEEEEEE